MKRTVLAVLLTVIMACTSMIPVSAEETAETSVTVDVKDGDDTESAENGIVQNDNEEGVNESGSVSENKENTDADTGENNITEETNETSDSEAQESGSGEENQTEDQTGDSTEDQTEDSTEDQTAENYVIVNENGNQYLEKSDGTPVYGLYTIPDTENTMFFDETQGGAAAVSAVVLIEDSETGEKTARLFDENGYMVTGTGKKQVDGKYYYVEDGIVISGWVETEENKMYFDPSTYEITIGIKEVEGVMRLFDNDGYLITGTQIAELNGNKYYVKDDILQSGWVEIGENKMFFSPKTYTAYYGVKKINGIMRFFDSDGYCIFGTKLVTFKGKQYYVKDDILTSGWVTVENHRMYFNPSNYVSVKGVANIGGVEYLFDNNGYCISGTKLITMNGKKYYVKNGVLQKGWVTVGSHSMYFNSSTYEATVGIKKISNKMRLFDKNGYCVTGTKIAVVNGKKYYVKKGVLQSGWYKPGSSYLYFDPITYAAAVGPTKIGKIMRLFDNNGYFIDGKRTIKISGKIYYVKGSVLQSGWATYLNHRMYLNTKTYAAAVGVTRIGGKMRLFDDNGYCILGTKSATVNGKVYAVKNGILQSGWVTINGKRMYCNKDTYEARTGVVTIHNKARVFDNNGYLATGTKRVVSNGKIYYVKNGILQTGWIKVGAVKMYLDPTTYTAATGKVKINGKTYTFSDDGYLNYGAFYKNGKTYYYKADGTLYRNTWIIYRGERLYVDKNGVGITDRSAYYSGAYSIRVDKLHCIVTVYKGGIPVRAMSCSVGVDGKTPSGTFHTGQSYRVVELMGPSWGQYATAIAGIKDVYFHSVATGNYNDVVHSVPTYEYNRLGNPASHGCIRLTVRDAKWIYDNIPFGTPVYIRNYSSNPLAKPATPKVVTSSVWCSDPTDPAAY